MFDQRESNDPSLPAELAALERQLAAIAPAALRIDRDRLMFEAGRANVLGDVRPRRPAYIAEPFRLGSKFWPAATALMTAASLLLALLVVRERASAPPMQIAKSTNVLASTIEHDPDAMSSFAASRRLLVTPDQLPAGYLGIRFVALSRGIGAVEDRSGAASESAGRSSPPASAQELLREMMPKNRNPSS